MLAGPINTNILRQLAEDRRGRMREDEGVLAIIPIKCGISRTLSTIKVIETVIILIKYNNFKIIIILLKFGVLGFWGFGVLGLGFRI